nr:hypothetical protein [Ardenticatena sp.]
MKRKWLFGLGAAAMALALTAGAAFVTTPVTHADAPDGTPRNKGFWKHVVPWFKPDTFDTLLAEELGISVDELEAARRRALDRALDLAVEDGLLSPEKAERIEAKHVMREYFDPLAVLAEQLGMSEDELEAAIRDGSMRALLADLDRQALRDALKEAWNAAIDQALADDAISESAAEQLRQMRGDSNGLAPGWHHRFETPSFAKPDPGRGHAFGKRGFGAGR